MTTLRTYTYDVVFDDQNVVVDASYFQYTDNASFIEFKDSNHAPVFTAPQHRVLYVIRRPGQS